MLYVDEVNLLHDHLVDILLDAAAPFTGRIDPAVPVTVAWAGRDLVLPPWQAHAARAALPHG